MSSIGKIVLGTAQFGLNYGINNSDGRVSRNEAKKILTLCQQIGIQDLDTAVAYGSSEELLGELLDAYFDVEDFRITTKFKYERGLSLETLVENSLNRLKRNNIESQLFHSLTDWLHYKSENKPPEISKWGVSVYSSEELSTVLDDSTIKVIQCPFNLLDNHSKRGESLRMAKEKGVEIQVRSAFLQGLFFMDRDSLPLSLIELKDPLEELDRICYENKITMSELALGYCLSKDYVDKVVIGVDSLNQLKLNIEAIKTPLPKIIIDEIDKITVKNQMLLNPTNW